jgi:hypothetical protein
MRVLIVRTAGGLCNRVWGLLGGAEYAAATERSFAFVWHPTHLCGARFDTLWTAPYREVGSRAASALARVVGTTRYAEVFVDDPKRVLMVSAADQLAVGDPRVRPLRERLATLRLVPALAERVARTHDEQLAGRPRTVGVMIRARADAHASVRASSPVEWFTRRMDEIRAEYPDVAFFLSTDSPEVSEQIHRRFADVAELRDKAPFNSATGVQDAVCDLYLLARTDFLLGSAGSSFPITAAWLAGHGGFETPLEASRIDLRDRL